MLTEQLDLTLRPNNINIMHLNVILPSMENKLFCSGSYFLSDSGKDRKEYIRVVHDARAFLSPTLVQEDKEVMTLTG